MNRYAVAVPLILISIGTIWAFLVLRLFAVSDQAPYGEALIVLHGLAAVGAWPGKLRPALIFGAAFGMLLMAAACFFLAVFFLPSAVMCWGAGMLASFQVPLDSGRRRNLRWLGWGVGLATAACVGFWLFMIYFPHSGESISVSTNLP